MRLLRTGSGHAYFPNPVVSRPSSPPSFEVIEEDNCRRHSAFICALQADFAGCSTGGSSWSAKAISLTFGDVAGFLAVAEQAVSAISCRRADDYALALDAAFVLAADHVREDADSVRTGVFSAGIAVVTLGGFRATRVAYVGTLVAHSIPFARITGRRNVAGGRVARLGTIAELAVVYIDGSIHADTVSTAVFGASILIVADNSVMRALTGIHIVSVCGTRVAVVAWVGNQGRDAVGCA